MTWLWRRALTPRAKPWMRSRTTSGGSASRCLDSVVHKSWMADNCALAGESSNIALGSLLELQHGGPDVARHLHGGLPFRPCPLAGGVVMDLLADFQTCKA
jgi:hypothetical protein